MSEELYRTLGRIEEKVDGVTLRLDERTKVDAQLRRDLGRVEGRVNHMIGFATGGCGHRRAYWCRRCEDVGPHPELRRSFHRCPNKIRIKCDSTCRKYVVMLRVCRIK